MTDKCTCLHEENLCGFCEHALRALLAAQEARAQRLEAALRMIRHAIDEGGNCWCAYFRVMHTPPDDAIPLRDGHTEECWTARAALSQPAATGEGT